MPTILSPSLHEHNFYPPLKERLDRALHQLGLDRKGYTVVICPDSENLADFMVKQFTQDRLVIEVKKTREDVAAVHTWKQARSYVTNSTTASLRYFCVTNGELLYLFRHEEGKRVAACLLQNGRKDLGRFGPGGEADAVLDRWEAAMRDLLRDLFVSQQEYALDHSFAGLIEKYQQAHALLAERLRRAVEARLTDPEWQWQFLAWCRTFTSTPEDPDNRAVAGEEAAHLILHRILCYELFRTQLDLLDEGLKKRFGIPRVSLKPLTAAVDAETPLAETFAAHFDALTRINYKQVFTRDPVLDYLPLDSEAEGILRSFLEDVDAFSFDVTNFEEAQRLFPTVFEALVPPEKRRRYGQVFTPTALADLLCRICITDPAQRILDPASGTGSFLDSAYERLNHLALSAGQELEHTELLDRLYGVEISTFPLHLCAVRLTLKHPALPTHARLTQGDFFQTDPQTLLDGKPVDVLLGNPPYIRQEALAEKEAIRNRIQAVLGETGPGGHPYPYTPRDADLYFYFVEYATAYLHEGGMAGWVLSDKFLVVDAGKQLKQFLLDHYHIRAVITLARRAFPEALVDNCVLVLERRQGGATPEEPTAFLKLRRPLPEAEIARMLEDPQSGANAYRRLSLRPRREIEAAEKWTRYLTDDRAVQAFLTAPGMMPLVAVATYERGPDNGCAAFFFPSEEWIEDFDLPDEYLTPAVERANDLQSLILRRGQCKRMLRVPPDVDLDAPEHAGLRTYLEYAASPEFDSGYRYRGHYVPAPERPIVKANAAGGPWWSFQRGSGDWQILVPRGFRTHYKVVANRARAHISTNFWGLRLRGAGRGARELIYDITFIAAFLNSSLGQLQVEREARRYAGFTKLERQELERLRVLDPQRVPPEARAQAYPLFLALDAAYGSAEYDAARERLDHFFLELLGCEAHYEDLQDLLEELVAERQAMGSVESE